MVEKKCSLCMSKFEAEGDKAYAEGSDVCPNCLGNKLGLVSLGLDTSVMQQDDYMTDKKGMEDPVKKDWDLRLIVLGLREYTICMNSKEAQSEIEGLWKKGDLDGIKDALMEASHKFYLAGIKKDDCQMVERMLDGYPGSEAGERYKSIFSTIKWVENWLYFIENVEVPHWV